MTSKVGFIIFVIALPVLSIIIPETASDEITPENEHTLDLSYWKKQPDSYVEDYDGNIRHRGVLVTDPNAYATAQTFTIAQDDEYISMGEMQRRIDKIKAEIEADEVNDEPKSLHDGSASITDMNNKGVETEKNEEPESLQDKSISITDMNKERVEAERNEEPDSQQDEVVPFTDVNKDSIEVGKNVELGSQQDEATPFTDTNKDSLEAEKNENSILCNEVTPNSAMNEVLPPTPDHGNLQIGHDRPLDLSAQIKFMRERRDDLKGLLEEFDEARSDAKVKDILSEWHKEQPEAEKNE